MIKNHRLIAQAIKNIKTCLLAIVVIYAKQAEVAIVLAMEEN